MLRPDRVRTWRCCRRERPVTPPTRTACPPGRHILVMPEPYRSLAPFAGTARALGPRRKASATHVLPSLGDQPCDSTDFSH